MTGLGTVSHMPSVSSGFAVDRPDAMRSGGIEGTARVFSVFALYGIVAFLLLQAQLFGDRNFFACCDSSIQSYAWLGKVAAAARRFSIPLWDFGAYAGISFAGELQPAPFYLPTLVLGVLGFQGMPLVDTFMVVHFALGASFMHLLLRGVGLNRMASVAGALMFAFVGYVPLQSDAQPNIYAGLVWIPLVMFFYMRAVSARRIREALTYTALAGATGAMQIAAGHLQPFIYTSYAVAVLALVDGARAKSFGTQVPFWSPRPFVLFLIGQGVAVGFAAVPLALSFQYLRLVYRWYGAGDTSGISTFPHSVSYVSWAQSAVLVWDDFRSLLNPAVRFALHGGTMFLTLTGACMALLSLIKPRKFVVALWLLAALSIVIALGGNLGPVARITFHLPLLSQTRTPVRAMYLFSFAAAGLAAVGIDRAVNLARMIWRPAGGAVAAVLLASVTYEVAAFTPSIGMPTTHPQYAPRYYEANPGLAAIERLSNTGPLVYRFYALPTDLIPPNAGDLKPVLGVLGHRGTMMVSEFDYISKGWGPAASDQLDRLGVRWVISERPLDGLPLVEQGNGYFIYERPGALSAFWTLDPVSGVRAPAPVEAVTWGDNTVHIRLGPIALGDKLVFAQPAYSGWTAEVDGRPVPLVSEEIFNAITVAGPMRDVTFAYRPFLWPWFVATLATTIFAALSAASWAWPRLMAPFVMRVSALGRRTRLASLLDPIYPPG